MNFDNIQFYVDFLTKGFYAFNAKDLLDGIIIEPFIDIQTKHPDLLVPQTGYENRISEEKYFELGSPDEKIVRRLGMEIGKRFLKDYHHTLQFDVCSYHVCKDVMDWHNDAELKFDGQNASINCFFDDTSEQTGGEFLMLPVVHRYKERTELVSSYYPKQFDIIILNQHPDWLHKVEPCRTFRRMISFACRFENFNKIEKRR